MNDDKKSDIKDSSTYDKKNNKPSNKREVGELSVKYLKFLFLNTRKKEMPNLEKDFRARRYYEDDFEEIEDSIIKTKPIASEILPELKKYLFNRLGEEDSKEEDVDNFIETNKANPPKIKRRRRVIRKYEDPDDFILSEELPEYEGEYEEDEDSYEDYDIAMEKYEIKDDYHLFDAEENDNEDFLKIISSKKNLSRKSFGKKSNHNDIDSFLNKYK